jgi:hypothetical protein
MSLTPEGRRPVEAYDATTLHTFLVEDAVKNHATWLPWAVKAYQRIGDLTGRGPDDAYQAVLDEVEALTGIRKMPVASPVALAELKALGL